MKINTSVEEMSNEVLMKTEKSYRGIIIISIISLVIMIAVAIFISFRQGFSPFTIMPVIFLPIYLNTYNMWKKLRAEMKKRDLP